ncbi:DUF4296 domain-containing protein [Pedobacter rhizosphaerae]|nr:DUF4296 domain-containing protein [Pedobacter rhizosphaerae]
MKRLMWVLAASLLMFGCKPGIPEHIIKPDKMEKIVYDMHIVDGYLSTIYIPDSAKRVAAAYYKGIYKKFNIDSVSYSRSLTYYNNNPDELEKIYKNISKKLDAQKLKMQKADSLSLQKPKAQETPAPK